MTRILVRMPNWVGDCVMATPALALMKRALPDAEIHALCRPSVAGILEDNPHIKSVIATNDKKMEAGVAAGIKATKFDAAALMTNSLGSAWLAFKLRIPRRIGFAREGRSILLTTRIPFNPLDWQTPTLQPLSRRSLKGAPRPGFPRHMVDYYLEIARHTIQSVTGDKNASIPQTDFKLVLPLNREAESKVATLLRHSGIMGKVLVGINPGAAHGPAKRWSPERLGHLVDGLQRPGWAFVSTASPGERELNDRVQATTNVPIHRLGEQASLRELPALISRLSVLVTNDSGAMHVAAARNVPVVALFGPTDWPSTRPWEAPTSLVRHSVPCSPCFLEQCPIHHPCMDGIEPFDVGREVMNQLHATNRWVAPA